MKITNTTFRRTKLLLVALSLFLASTTTFAQSFALPQLKRVVVSGGIDNRCKVKVQYQQIENIASSPILYDINRSNRIHVFSAKEAGALPDKNAISYTAKSLLDYYTPGMQNLPWCEVEQSARVVRGKYLLFITTSTIYAGGAHPLYGVTHTIYDLAKGGQVIMPDLTEGYWWWTLRRNLYKRCHQQLDDLFAIHKLEDMPRPSTYELTDKGVVFVFEPYEVAPGVVGTVTVEFSDVELKQMGVPITW